MTMTCALIGDIGKRQIARTLLRQLEFDSIVESRDGVSAMKMLKVSAPKIAFVLMELNARKIDGISLLGEIRSCPELSHLPVVMFATEATKQDVIKAVELGVNGYIVMPFNAATFCDTLKKLRTH